jgi:hypothetical protein
MAEKLEGQVAVVTGASDWARFARAVWESAGL